MYVISRHFGLLRYFLTLCVISCIYFVEVASAGSLFTYGDERSNGYEIGAGHISVLNSGFSIPLKVECNDASFVRTFGTSLYGTDGYDTGLDIVCPPAGFTFYAYFFINIAPHYLDTDIRSWSDTSIIWSLKVVNTFGSTGKVTWDPDGFPPEVIFVINGTDMRGDSSVIFEGDQILYITAIDTTPPEVPILLEPCDSCYTNDSTPTFSWSNDTTALVTLIRKETTWADKGLTVEGIRSGRGGCERLHKKSTEVTYTLQYSTDGSFSDTQQTVTFYNLKGDSCTLPDSLALSDTVYHWRLEAIDGAQNHSGYQEHPFVLFVDTQAPDTPRLIEPVDSTVINDSMICFIWHASDDKGSGIDHYILEYANNQSFVNATAIAVVETTYTPLSGLADTIYYWHIKAVDLASNESHWSNSWSFEIDTRVPNVPVLIEPGNASFVADTAVIFEWTEVRYARFSSKGQDGTAESNILSSEVRYVLQVDTASLFIEPFMVDTVKSNMDTINIGEGTYFWRVQAYDLAGNQGTFSAPFSFTLDITSPTAFDLVSPPDSSWLDTTRPTFVWEASSDSLSGINRYQVYIDDVLVYSILDTSWVAIYDLDEDYHSWYVVAYDSADNCRVSEVTQVVGVDTTSPAVPTLSLPGDKTMTNDHTPTFTWKASVDNLSGIDYYIIQYADNLSFIDKDSIHAADTSFTPTSVLSDTIYYWRAKAVDRAENETDWSSAWSFEIDTQVPGVPTLMSPIGGDYVNNIAVEFEWTDIRLVANERSESNGIKGALSPPSPIRYVLQVDTSISFVSPVVVETVGATRDTVRLSEVNYYWRVKAYDLAGNQGHFSDIDSFGVDTTVPVFSGTTIWSDTSFGGPFLVASTVYDALAGIEVVSLYYRLNEGDWVHKLMPGKDSLYKDSIPQIDSVAKIDYYVRAMDRAANEATDPVSAPGDFYSFVRLGIHEQEAIPGVVVINYSNPSILTTTIRFTLPEESPVSLKVYDMSGRLLKTLVDGELGTGRHTVNWNNIGVPAGIYFCKIQVGSCIMAKKLILLR